jgi:hypothetical protein
MKKYLFPVSLIILSSCILTMRTFAAVLWTGDPEQGTKVFRLLNLEGGAQVSVVADATYGKVFRFYKPSGSNRCESSHCTNYRAAEGDLLYLGWRFKVDMSQSQTTNAVFQWHSYPTSQIQNYPIVIKTISGTLWFEQYNPNGTTPVRSSTNVRNALWSTPFIPNKWFTVVLAIKYSLDVKQGYVEFWYEGTQQTLRNGSTRFVCRTHDGDYSDPKWGVYGASNATVTNYVCGLRIGSDYESANPDAPTPVRMKLSPGSEGISGSNGSFPLRIYDMSGRTVAELPFLVSQGTAVSFNRYPRLAPGMYYACRGEGQPAANVLQIRK